MELNNRILLTAHEVASIKRIAEEAGAFFGKNGEHFLNVRECEPHSGQEQRIESSSIQNIL